MINLWEEFIANYFDELWIVSSIFQAKVAKHLLGGAPEMWELVTLFLTLTTVNEECLNFGLWQFEDIFFPQFFDILWTERMNWSAEWQKETSQKMEVTL